jgi:hypothetical protein
MSTTYAESIRSKSTNSENNITSSNSDRQIKNLYTRAETLKKKKLPPVLLPLLFQPNRKVDYHQSGLPKLSPNLEAMIRGVAKLAEVDPDFQNDEYILNPSNYAIAETLALLTNLDLLLGQDFPKGYVMLESRGGIYLNWEAEEFYKEVMVEIAAAENIDSSVFYCDDYRDQDNLIENPSLSKIAELLDWLKTDRPII